MFACVRNYVSSCETCQECKATQQLPKAELVPLIVPDRPMHFISFDIAYLEPDDDGFRYMLLIGCVFSKFIVAVPLQSQTASAISQAIQMKWIYQFGAPHYILSDRGSNVDGEALRETCRSLNVEKRRTSGYHAQCNGFAERSIRNVREILRTALLDKNIPQSCWRDILPSVVFALNTSLSTTTKCSPYEVVFGRKPTLPLDVYFDCTQDFISDCTSKHYLEDLRVQLKETIQHVSKFLNLNLSNTTKV